MKPVMPKPEWLKKQIFFTKENQELRNRLKYSTTNTVCQEARCPNLSECYNKGTATFMIMGRICSRSCRFCSVESQPLKKRHLLPALDENEPEEIARLIKEMHLNFAVITSVARDDLEDEGASHFAKTIKAIKRVNPYIKCEVLTPDFHAKKELIEQVINSQPEVFNHNMETVFRLSNFVRNGANYIRSLKVLEIVKQLDSNMVTKSGIMLGFGETESELIQLFKDLSSVNCDILTIGQYLQPTRRNIQVQEYVPKSRYQDLKNIAKSIGIKVIHAGPFVRSSYRANESYDQLKFKS